MLGVRLLCVSFAGCAWAERSGKMVELLSAEPGVQLGALFAKWSISGASDDDHSSSRQGLRLSAIGVIVVTHFHHIVPRAGFHSAAPFGSVTKRFHVVGPQ